MSLTNVAKLVIRDTEFDRAMQALPDAVFVQPPVQAKLNEQLLASKAAWGVTLKAQNATENALVAENLTKAEDAAKANAELIPILRASFDAIHASFYSALLLIGCFFTQVSAEYGLNAGVLGWLSGATGRNAVIVALAAALVPVILDKLLGNLLGSEPWDAHTPAKGARKAFLLFATLLNGVAILLVAMCRGIAALVKSGGTMTGTNVQVVDAALILLSFAIGLNAAILYLYGTAEFRAAAKKRELLHELFDAEERRPTLVAAVEDARRAKALADHRAENFETMLAAFLDEFEKERRLQIQARISGIFQAMDHCKVVELEEKRRIASRVILECAA